MHSYSWRFEAPLTRKYQKKQRFAEEWQKNVSNCGMLGWWGATPNTLQQKQHYRLKIAYLIKQKKYWHLSWLHLNNNYLCIFERNSNTEYYSQPERIRSSLLISVPHSIHCTRCISFTASCWFFHPSFKWLLKNKTVAEYLVLSLWKSTWIFTVFRWTQPQKGEYFSLFSREAKCTALTHKTMCLKSHNFFCTRSEASCDILFFWFRYMHLEKKSVEMWVMIKKRHKIGNRWNLRLRWFSSKTFRYAFKITFFIRFLQLQILKVKTGNF